MVTSLKRVQTPLDDAHTKRLDDLVARNPEHLMALTSVLGVEVQLPRTQAGAAGALLSTLLDRVEAEVMQRRLAAHYALMFPGGHDDPDDREGLATDRALAAAAAASYGDGDEADAITEIDARGPGPRENDPADAR